MITARLPANRVMLFPVPHTPGDSWLREEGREMKFALIPTCRKWEGGGVMQS